MSRASEISARLAERIEELAETLFGGPPTFRSYATIRFRNRGSMVIETRGDTRGVWCDHESGEGGDALDLVRHVRQCSTVEALTWAQDWLGGPYTPPRSAPDYRPPDKTNRLETALKLWREAVS